MIPGGGGGRNPSIPPMLGVFSTEPTFGSDYTGGVYPPSDFQHFQFLQFQAQITAYHMITRTQLLPPQLLASVGCNTGHTAILAHGSSSPWHSMQSLSNYSSSHLYTSQPAFISVLPYPGTGITMSNPFYVESLVASQPVHLGHGRIVDQAVVYPHPDQQPDLHTQDQDKGNIIYHTGEHVPSSIISTTASSTSSTSSSKVPLSRQLQPQHYSTKSNDNQKTKVDIFMMLEFCSAGVLLSLSLS